MVWEEANREISPYPDLSLIRVAVIINHKIKRLHLENSASPPRSKKIQHDKVKVCPEQNYCVILKQLFLGQALS
ncbi:hypothetical protein D1406_26070 [Escherichia coli]|nr:hypothetical protein [Escherichia coli]